MSFLYGLFTSIFTGSILLEDEEFDEVVSSRPRSTNLFEYDDDDGYEEDKEEQRQPQLDVMTVPPIPPPLQLFRSPEELFDSAPDQLFLFQTKLFQANRFVLSATQIAERTLSSDPSTLFPLLRQLIHIYLAKFMSDQVSSSYLHENIWYMIARLFYEIPNISDEQRYQAYYIFNKDCADSDFEEDFATIQDGTSQRLLPHVTLYLGFDEQQHKTKLRKFFEAARYKDFLFVFQSQREPTSFASLCGAIDVSTYKFRGSYGAPEPVTVGLICAEKGVREVGDLMFFYYVYCLLCRPVPSVGLLELSYSYLNLPGFCLYHKYQFKPISQIGDPNIASNLYPQTIAEYFNDDNFDTRNLQMDFLHSVDRTSPVTRQFLLDVWLKRRTVAKPMACQVSAKKDASMLDSAFLILWQRFKILDDFMSKTELGMPVNMIIDSSQEHNTIQWDILKLVAEEWDVPFKEAGKIDNMKVYLKDALHQHYTRDPSSWAVVHAKLQAAIQVMESEGLLALFPPYKKLRRPSRTHLWYNKMEDELQQQQQQGENSGSRSPMFRKQVLTFFSKTSLDDFLNHAAGRPQPTSKAYVDHQNYVKKQLRRQTRQRKKNIVPPPPDEYRFPTWSAKPTFVYESDYFPQPHLLMIKDKQEYILSEDSDPEEAAVVKAKAEAEAKRAATSKSRKRKTTTETDVLAKQARTQTRRSTPTT